MFRASLNPFIIPESVCQYCKPGRRTLESFGFLHWLCYKMWSDNDLSHRYRPTQWLSTNATKIHKLLYFFVDFSEHTELALTSDLGGVSELFNFIELPLPTVVSVASYEICTTSRNFGQFLQKLIRISGRSWTACIGLCYNILSGLSRIFTWSMKKLRKQSKGFWDNFTQGARRANIWRGWSIFKNLKNLVLFFN